MARNVFDVVVVGGSYAGLSAALALGRALRKVLIVDAGKPCNRFAPHSQNFLTHDGSVPAEIAALGRTQVLAYPTVHLIEGVVETVEKVDGVFKGKLEGGTSFGAKKVIFATGIKDEMPKIPGFKEAWGKSIIHCPYCHGYEFNGQETGILANGENAMHYAQLLYNWTPWLSVLTNGEFSFTSEQKDRLVKRKVEVLDKKIQSISQEEGVVTRVEFIDGSSKNLNVIYSKPVYKQHCSIPMQLGCELTEMGLLKVDAIQKTNVSGVYACGDNSSPMRAVSQAVSSGTVAGAACNNDLTFEEY